MSESNTFVRTHNPSPVGQLKTDRGFWKLFFLSLITLGIYPIVFWSGISNDINVIASRYDGKKTMHYCLLFFVVNPLTLSSVLLTIMSSVLISSWYISCPLRSVSR